MLRQKSSPCDGDDGDVVLVENYVDCRGICFLTFSRAVRLAHLCKIKFDKQGMKNYAVL